MHNTYDQALKLLRGMLGESAVFREGQWEAISSLVLGKKRVLLVQKTGWGKSIVYFIATRMLRIQGAGPTLLISPLLSLMRDQIKMAEKIGIRAHTINSTNEKTWAVIEENLTNDGCDVLLISPERLNNHHFRNNVLPKFSGRLGLFVIDEAHCISDWGHDFRPDYKRIVRILQQLPSVIPVLGTTATANNRVILDIKSQIGENLVIQRGSLAREGLRLQNIDLGSQAARYAWLVENLPKFGEEKRGIIYCQTVHDTEQLAEWLIHKGYKTSAYHGNLDTEERERLENDFKNNLIDIIVATVALGMGFDKPDVFFVIHYQCPGSVVHYYQQVGRAGRQMKKSYGILLSGNEDEAVQEYFIKSAFPSSEVMQNVIQCLENSEALSFNQIISRINVSNSVLKKALQLLELDRAIGVDYQGRKMYFRTSISWNPDAEKNERISALRRDEVDEMKAYVHHKNCLMKFLQIALNDPNPSNCGICANCQNQGFPAVVDANLINEAQAFIKAKPIEFEPRKKWPAGLFSPDVSQWIPEMWRNMSGCALCHYGDGAWGKAVRAGKYQHGHFDDKLVEASAQLILGLWKPYPEPKWVVPIPSTRHPKLVPEFSQALAKALNIPYQEVFSRKTSPPEQKTMENSLFQAKNVFDSLKITGKILADPILLVDDIVDSLWTMTMAGYILQKNGSGPVFPFALAKATGRKF